MASETDNLVLEQLRLIRKEIGEVNGKIDELQVGQQSLQGVVMGLGHYMHSIDGRVEHLEEKLGVES